MKHNLLCSDVENVVCVYIVLLHLLFFFVNSLNSLLVNTVPLSVTSTSGRLCTENNDRCSLVDKDVGTNTLNLQPLRVCTYYIKK